MITQELAHIRTFHDALSADQVVDLYISLARQQPHEPRVYQSLALFHMLKENFGAAVQVIDRALSMRKDPTSYFIKARALDESMDFAGSIECYKKCLGRDKHNNKAKFYLSLAYLRLGDFEQGAPLYRHRLMREQIARFRGTRLWSPRARQGRVFVWAEQGIGDEVMFLQLLHLVPELDFAFTVECDRRLISTLQANFPDITFVARNSSIDRRQFDYHFPIGGLFSLFYQPLLNGKVKRPSLTPVSRGDVEMRASEAKARTKLIGLSWASASKDYGARRSVSIETLCRNLNPAQHSIAILQYLAAEEDVIKMIERGFSCIAEFDCFNDIEAAFALIAACDHVMSIDNSVVHFAGAAGVDTHLVLPEIPNWRWGVSDATPCWYPNVHLHRRTPNMSWEAVVDEISLT